MADRTGQALGNYRLTQLLGRGGFAEVYLGEHLRLKSQAAIKVLYTRLDNDNSEEFLQEAQTVAHLVHPNIVRIFDFDVKDGIPFLVMDYAPGGTLRQRHPRNTRLPLDTIVSYIKQVADALQYAHDEKFIHRDIKPENMLIGRRNEILLSDFGIALIARTSHSQSTQDVIGTVAYMAPEQIQGKPRLASDQYSLGIVVYEWLSGDRPFHGSFTELCTQHIFASPPPLQQKISMISSEVEQVVQTALAKDPHQRFASVQAFATALEQACLSVQHLPNVSPSQPLEPIVAVIPPTQHVWPTIPVTSLSQLPEPTVISTPSLQEERTKPDVSRRTVLAGLAGLAIVGIAGGITWLARPHSSTPAHTPTLTSPPLGTILYTYHVHPYGGPVVWSPKNQRIAYGNSYGVEVWDVVTGNRIFTYFGHSGHAVNCMAWSPDGKHIASGSDDVQVWDATTGKRILTYSGHSAFLTSVAWAPDSTRIASASNDKTAQVWDAATGEQFLVYKGHSDEVTSVSWSPDGKRIASASFDQTAQVWDAITGTSILTYTGHSDRIWVLAWSLGKYIASGSFDGIIQVWNATTGKQLIAYHGHYRQGHDSQINSIAWSPNGKHIASTGYDETVQIWDATSGNNIYRGSLSQASGLAWSPDGTRLACGTYSTGIVEVLQAV